MEVRIKKDIFKWVNSVYATSKEREERLRQDVMLAIRKAMRRPMAVIRERQKRTEENLREHRKLEVSNKIALGRINNSPRIEYAPIVAINMLVVEALFLLENRMAIKTPKHNTIIRNALTTAERFTMADMGPELRKLVYGRDIEENVLNNLLQDSVTDFPVEERGIAVEG